MALSEAGRSPAGANPRGCSGFDGGQPLAALSARRNRHILSPLSQSLLWPPFDQLGHSVQDQTGLKGVFDFTLEWEPDAESTGADGAPATSADVRTGASLITAIQEQLGLKLEARKGPVEVFVIDHIESTPTEN
jgi:uncharacterized protein (TIGR03435 family)